ncbi:hypothetical protein [Streptomyces noursei]|uniref:hypothetical protein n=1 Tax=Streptomyces noursei TaxID=1971 RepID=UPI0030F2A92F
MDGLVAAAPADTPLNHCGGGELPLSRDCTTSGAPSEPGSLVGTIDPLQNVACLVARNNLDNPNVNVLS